MTKVTMSMLSAMGLAWFSGGCAMEGAMPGEEAVAFDEGTTSEENTGSISQEAALGWFTGPFAFSTTQGRTRRLEAVDTHVCALTRVSGQFKSSTEQVRVSHDDTHWFLETRTGAPWVGGEAHCYRKDAFTQANTTRFVSSERALEAFWREDECLTLSTNGLSGSAFTFLTGIGNEWAGGGEWARIDQSPSDSVASTFTAQNCASDRLIGVAAFARSFRVGPVHGRIATFYTAEDRWGDANSPTALFAASSNQRVVMAKTKFTMCALTKIQGQLNGGGESVQIRAEMVDGVERWVLKTTRGAGSDMVKAEARCYARDQTG